MPVFKLQDTMKIQRYCQRILESDPNVALVAVIDRRGRTLELRTKKEQLSCLDERDLEMLFMQRALQTTMIRESDEKLGTFNFTLTNRGRFCEYTKILNDAMLFVLVNSTMLPSEITSIVDTLNENHSGPEAAPVLAA